MLSPIVGTKEKYAFRQDQCRLLQLPKEILHMIYEEVVGRDKVYIIFHPTLNKLAACQERNIPNDEDPMGHNTIVKMGMGVLPTLQTCKMM